MALLLQLRCLRWSSRIVPSSPSTINCRCSPKSEFLHAGRLGSAQAILQAVLKPRITQELLQGGGSHALLVHFRRPFPLTPRSSGDIGQVDGKAGFFGHGRQQYLATVWTTSTGTPKCSFPPLCPEPDPLRRTSRRVGPARLHTDWRDPVIHGCNAHKSSRLINGSQRDMPKSDGHQDSGGEK